MAALRYIASLLVAVAGCSFDRGDHAQACANDEECGAGRYCYAQLCVEDSASGEGCAQGSQIEVCYDGPAQTREVGACGAGQRICIGSALSECLGQTLPSREVCNGKDDDCNGKVDDTQASAACDSHLQGACGEGKLVCRSGVELCEPVRESQKEACNKVDDDCDGNTDELSASVCYPSEVQGCSPDAEGSWQCRGACATGFTECDAGAGSCGGASTPQQEACTTGATLAQDEDCDGMIDEGCTCSHGAYRDCYAGPAGTNGYGQCRAGTQRCENQEWGACADQIVPRPEDCTNAGSDDDCNGLVDDVPGLGSACVAEGASGLCRNGTLQCIGGDKEPSCIAGAALAEVCDDLDQDCDGDPANGFDFTSDATCGSCGMRCSAVQTCCNGQCLAVTALEEDVANCGSCGQACGTEQYCCQGRCLSVGTMQPAPCDCRDACGDRACCGMDCRDLESDRNNCGACGRKCGKDQSCIDGLCEDDR